MITELNCEVLDDVSSPNPLLAVIPGLTRRVAAAVWTVRRTGALVNARTACLQHVLERAMQMVPPPQLWILLGHRVAQPDNRITRHHGLWGSLKARGLKYPPAPRFEYLQQIDGGIRFLGAAKFRPEEADWVNALMLTEQAVVAMMYGEDVERIIQGVVIEGWSLGGSKPPHELIEALCETNLLVDLHGEFDDVEITAMAFGAKEIVSNLCT